MYDIPFAPYACKVGILSLFTLRSVLILIFFFFITWHIHETQSSEINENSGDRQDREELLRLWREEDKEWNKGKAGRIIWMSYRGNSDEFWPPGKKQSKIQFLWKKTFFYQVWSSDFMSYKDMMMGKSKYNKNSKLI